MCLGELGRVVAVDGDVAVVRTGRGAHEASLLLASDVAVGADVVVHSGHVLAVVTPAQAMRAAALRAGAGTAGDAPTPSTGDGG